MNDDDETGDVLLIEDNPGDARLTRELLEERGVDGPSYVVSSGAEALDFLFQRGEYADAPRPDLVLLDWHLQRMNGGEILEEIRNDEDLADVPVVVLSGSGMEIETLKETDPEADRYLTKPIEPDEYRAITDELRTD